MNFPLKSYPLLINRSHSMENHSLENEFGETPLPYAPVSQINNGKAVVAQQFLDVNRSLESVESILANIELPDQFILFAGQENGLVFLVCAVLGHENYTSPSKKESGNQELKIVYGRRWLLEPTTPTSEVVQTAFLAVKKAREHELRERIIISVALNEVSEANTKICRTTPFNCHMDLPLMAQSPTSFDANTDALWSVESTLTNTTVDDMRPILVATHQLGGNRVVYDIGFENGDLPTTQFAEFKDLVLSVVCEKGTEAEFLHELFDALLRASDAHMNEVMRFKQFARFSQDICPLELARFSVQTRKAVMKDPRFEQHFTQMSYQVDSSKAPSINRGNLGEQQMEHLQSTEKQRGKLAGYLPHGYTG